MNIIAKLLNFEDSDIFISDTSIQGTTKTSTFETKLYAHYCPSCGYRMHSRGIKNRTIKHPILQDNYKLILIITQRRWMCINPKCKYNISDSLSLLTKAYVRPMLPICSLFMFIATLWKQLHPLLTDFTPLTLMHVKFLAVI